MKNETKSKVAKRAWVTRKRRDAGRKAAATRKQNALFKKRSIAAKKAWATRRAAKGLYLQPDGSLAYMPCCYQALDDDDGNGMVDPNNPIYNINMNDSIDDFVCLAEKLQAEYGSIGSVKYAFPYLYATMKNHPEKFAHIKRGKVFNDSKKQTVDEWVKTAEFFENAADGSLPNVAWLKKYGYTALLQVMRKYPEKFAHIKQEKKANMTPEEWVVLAEKLAKENNGMLPDVAWLKKHGYTGLVSAVKKHPSKFTHICKSVMLFFKKHSKKVIIPIPKT
jgi:hypothetical protein